MTTPTDPTSRTLRIFVSSTFRDMQAERERLVKFAFPELRRRCRERGVELVEVDLRWGVTEAQAERGEVLPVCLAEIRRCDYFVGLLGERYGFVPAHIAPALLEEQPWLAAHSAQSYTALEILHGVLNTAEPAGHAFFYFRDPGYLERLSPEARGDYASESPEAQAKLAALKAQIRAGAEQGQLTLRTDYPDPATVAEWIRDDLWQAIDARYPEGSAPDPLEREAAEHAAFAASRARVYIPRVVDGHEIDLDRLDAHAAGEGPPLILIGESGVGKSALLANWVRRHRNRHPSVFVVEHYLGSSPQSAEYVALMRRICEEINRYYQLPDEIPVTAEKLREALPISFAAAHAKGGMVLILDALNQLEDRDNAPDLGWLPAYIPPKVRLICSTLPGRSRGALEKREWSTYEVIALTAKERRDLVHGYLSHYGKQLSESQIRPITDAPPTQNPLYLRALLDELRVLGSRHDLDTRISDCLNAADPKALYGRILQRLESDYEGPRPGLVGDTLSLLWAARQGLTEAELLSLLGQGVEPLPQAYWSPLHLVLAESLISRSGLLGFSHDYLRNAVRERYLPTEASQHRAHLRVADYFANRPVDTRGADELPWQLREARELPRLKNCLIDREVFQQLYSENDPWELSGYWLALGDCYDMATEYTKTVESAEAQQCYPVELALWQHQLAIFLMRNARYAAARPLFEKALAAKEKILGQEHSGTAAIRHDLAVLLHEQGDYAAAEPLYRAALATEEKALGKDDPATAATEQQLASLLADKGSYAAAEPLFRAALATHEKVLGPNHPETAITRKGLASLLMRTGDYAAAESGFRTVLASWERSLGPDHPNTAGARASLAILLQLLGNLEDAERLYRRALETDESVLGPQHPSTNISRASLASLLATKGDYVAAEALYRTALAAEENALGPDHPDVAISRHQLAAMLREKGDLAGAEALTREALATEEKALGPDHPHTAQTRQNLAVILYDKRDYTAAEPVFRMALSAKERALGGDHPDTAVTKTQMASLMQAKGDYATAETLYRDALGVQEKVLGPGHPATADTKCKLATLLSDKGDDVAAEPLYLSALAANEKSLGPDHPSTAYMRHQLAFFLQTKGDDAAAEPLYRQALAATEKTLGASHPRNVSTRHNLARLLQKRGDRAGAERLYRAALATAEKARGPDHPDTSAILNDYAGLLEDKGEYELAESLHRRALAIRESVYGGDHTETAFSLNNLGVLLQARGNDAAAEPLVRRALGIFEKNLGAEHPHTVQTRTNLSACLGNQALVLRDRGDLDGALALMREQERLAREAESANGVATSLANQADLLSAKMDEPRAALPLADEAYRIATEHGLNALAEQIRLILDAVRVRCTEGIR